MNTVVIVAKETVNIYNESLLYQDAVSYKGLVVTQISQDSDPRDFGYLLEHLIGTRLRQTPYKACEVYMIFKDVEDAIIEELHKQITKNWSLQLAAVDSPGNKKVLGYKDLPEEDDSEPRPKIPRMNLDWLEN